MASGLTDALRKFGKCRSDVELVEGVVSSGVWAALLNFMNLSNEPKK